MKKRATSEPSCQPQVAVQLPLPVLSRLRAVREGFFELCLRVGEQALDALMEQDRTELCGPKWARPPSRQAGRGGSTASEITLGGRRIRVRRLRARLAQLPVGCRTGPARRADLAGHRRGGVDPEVRGDPGASPRRVHRALDVAQCRLAALRRPQSAATDPLCQGRSKSRPRWRRKTRPPGRWGGVSESGCAGGLELSLGAPGGRAQTERKPVRTAGGVAGGRSQDAGAAAGRRAFLLWARR